MLLLFVLVMYSLGIACLFFARGVQSYAVKAVATGVTRRSEALKSFVRSREYLVSVRAVGVVALLAGVFLTFAMLRRGS